MEQCYYLRIVVQFRMTRHAHATIPTFVLNNCGDGAIIVEENLLFFLYIVHFLFTSTFFFIVYMYVLNVIVLLLGNIKQYLYWIKGIFLLLLFHHLYAWTGSVILQRGMCNATIINLSLSLSSLLCFLWQIKELECSLDHLCVHSSKRERGVTFIFFAPISLLHISTIKKRK